MKTIQEKFTEQVRNESFKEVLNDPEMLNEKCLMVIEPLKGGPKTLQQISKITGMKEHLVSARLNDLREAEFVNANGRKIINPETNKPNSLWEINWKKFNATQLNIFS